MQWALLQNSVIRGMHWRDRQAAPKFLKKLMRRHGSPEQIATDRLRSYGAARFRRIRTLQKFVAVPASVTNHSIRIKPSPAGSTSRTTEPPL